MRLRARSRSGSGIPTFTTATTVDIDIDPDELIDAGWEYVGTDSNRPPSEQHVIDTVRDWHDQAHNEPWRFCSSAPCKDLNQ